MPVFHLASYVLGLLTATILLGSSLFVLRRPDPPAITVHPPPTPIPTATPAPTPTPSPITVFISGAVRNPGLYALPSGARVGDVLAMSGGYTEDAATEAINQAEKLWDGAHVHVPSQDDVSIEAPPAGVSGSAPAAAGGDTRAISVDARIHLNTATAAELESLPGIGAAKAQAIIANRPFASVDDLERVPGIGPKTVDQLRAQVVAP